MFSETSRLRHCPRWLRRTDGWRRRCEDPKLSLSVRRRRPPGRQQGTRESQIQPAHDQVRLVSVILAFPDARSAWRWTPVRRAGALGASRVEVFLRLFDSSILRRQSWVGLSVTVHGVDSFITRGPSPLGLPYDSLQKAGAPAPAKLAAPRSLFAARSATFAAALANSQGGASFAF